MSMALWQPWKLKTKMKCKYGRFNLKRLFLEAVKKYPCMCLFGVFDVGCCVRNNYHREKF